MERRSKTIISGAAATLVLATVFYPRGGDPLPHAFDVIEFIPPPVIATEDSEWLARAKYDLVTRGRAATREDIQEYAIFLQEYAEARLRQMSEQTIPESSY